MGNGPDCIVSYVDLIGTTELIMSSKHSEWLNIFQEFNNLLINKSTQIMPMHNSIYLWNDSAVFLAYTNDYSEYEPILKEVNNIKREIDKINKSYIVCIKGQTIELNNMNYNSKVHYLEFSSMAFANCFEVIDYIKNNNKKKTSWYIDERIVKEITIPPEHIKNKVLLLPNDTRYIYKINSYLW